MAVLQEDSDFAVNRKVQGVTLTLGRFQTCAALELARMMSLKIGHIVCNSFNFHNIYCKNKIFYGCRLQSLQTSEVEFRPTVP